MRKKRPLLKNNAPLGVNSNQNAVFEDRSRDAEDSRPADEIVEREAEPSGGARERGRVIRPKRGDVYTFPSESDFDSIPPHESTSSPPRKSSGRKPKSIPSPPKFKTLRFGDAWAVDQMFKRFGLDKVMEEIAPDHFDTLKALVSYKLTNSDSFVLAEYWFQFSFARILYPQADMVQDGMKNLHDFFRDKEVHETFFKLCRENFRKIFGVYGSTSFPILIDSLVIHEFNGEIKPHNYNLEDESDREGRFIYVVDALTMSPSRFRIDYGCGSYDTALTKIINELKERDVHIGSVMTDFGIYGSDIFGFLTDSGVPIITFAEKYGELFMKLLKRHGADLENPRYFVPYGEGGLYVKKIPFDHLGRIFSAYLIHDVQKAVYDQLRRMLGLHFGPDVVGDSISTFGKFILLSFKNYKLSEVVDLYRANDLAHDFLSALNSYTVSDPDSGIFHESFRGASLICFIADIVRSLIDRYLKGSSVSKPLAFARLRNLFIKCYDKITVVEDPTSEQKKIFKLLRLDCPFFTESGKLFPKALSPLKFPESPLCKGKRREKKAAAPPKSVPSSSDPSKGGN
ncbi:MAG: hypothetical protein LBR53_07215 [Deltaproteobacteria bacterium]|jgi:hypothetical protein|nr:hypothetical protein [Deltaproteobacteria bacterium]